MKTYLALAFLILSTIAVALRGPGGFFDLEKIECVYIDSEKVVCDGEEHIKKGNSLDSLASDVKEVEASIEGENLEGKRAQCQLLEDYTQLYDNGVIKFRIQVVSCLGVDYKFEYSQSDVEKEPQGQDYSPAAYEGQGVEEI